MNNRLTDEGVTWEVPQTINPERDLNDIFVSAMPFRVEADEMVSFNLKEFTAEVISKALGCSSALNGRTCKYASGRSFWRGGIP